MKHHLKHLLSQNLSIIWKTYSNNFNKQKLRDYLICEHFAYPLNIPINIDDESIVKELRIFAQHCHKEYLYDYKGTCFIEPKYGYIITQQLFLVECSFAYYHLVNSKPLQNL
ncbi:MAG: hypothetical protein PUP91_19925, partial [Rhizonema sp. PD37]|nr:hypothetical protein [Rhizonema sp. PD37]